MERSIPQLFRNTFSLQSDGNIYSEDVVLQTWHLGMKTTFLTKYIERKYVQICVIIVGIFIGVTLKSV